MLRRAAAAAPASAWLVAIVVVSSGVRFVLARHMVAPWIMVDEIVYSELAKSLAATGHFAVRGVPTSGYGDVYPILISPAYALFDSIPTVYGAIKAINAVLVSLAAVPAYLLARRVVSQFGALVVAVLTVAVPSTFYAGAVMTENAFYPIFLFAALALVVALERPALRTVLVFVVALAVAYETRAQAIVLLPAALAAPLVLAALSLRPRVTLAYRWLYLVLLGLAAAAVGAEIGRGHSVRSLFGAYAAATHGGYHVREIARWTLWHLSELDLYVAALPVLALVVLVGQARRLAIEERAFLAATLAVVALTAVEVAAFASQESRRIEERNLFYVAPLLFVCLVDWIEHRAPRPPVPTALGALGAVGLLAAVPYQSFIGVSALSDTFALLPLWSLSNWFTIPLTDLRLAVAVAAAVLVAVALAVPRRAAFVLPALVLLLYAAAAQTVDARTERASIGALFQGVANADRDWVTAAVGSRAGDVAIVWPGAPNNDPDALVVYQSEFWNRAVGAVYTTRGPLPGGLAQSPITLDKLTGRYLAGGRAIHVSDVLTHTSVPIAGRLLGRDGVRGLELVRVGGLLRAPYVTFGIYPDLWGGARVVFRRFECVAGSVLRVRLQSDPTLLRGPQIVRAYEFGDEVGEAGVPAHGTTVFRVRLQRGRADTCAVVFRAERSAVPARVEHGSTDTRRLAVRYVGFSVGGTR